MRFYPSDLAIGEVYLPPLLVAGVLGLLMAAVTARLFNRFRLARHFFHPPLVFVALAMIYMLFIGAVLIPF
jgi:hypothetical protein